MKFEFLIVGTIFVLPITNVNAALDRSGQSVLPFLEDGNYSEFGITVVDPNISGTVKNRLDLIEDSSDLNLGKVSNSFDLYNFALKFQLNNYMNLGLLFDQPFGADINYPVRKNGSFSDNIISHQGTSVKVETQNLSLILGISPFNSFQFYGGPVYQQVKANIELRGKAYTDVFNGYNAKFKRDSELGWLAGISYQIPEISLKAAITYRSKIKYNISVDENILGLPLNLISEEKTKLETPQSINIDFQTGISKNVLAYSNFRWVNWKNFETRPAQFGALSEILTDQATNGGYKNGFKLDSYEKDQYSATVGLGYELNKKWSFFSDLSVDSGTGNPASPLGPVNKSWGLGLGFKYNPNSNYFISGGVRYFWLNDTTTQDGTYYLPIEGIQKNSEQADFKGNNIISYVLKIGYQF